ncbi:MAG: hypothetical protein ABI210_13970 [Abditibacteriaceae bacterium]
MQPRTSKVFHATLPHNRVPEQSVMDMLPSDHVSQESFLRLCNLPVEKLGDEVLVVKLEFEESLH